MHTTSTNYLYKQIAIELLEQGQSISNDDVLRTFQVRYPEEWAAEVNRMAHAGAKRAIQGVLKTLDITDDDEGGQQLVLPGVELPATFTLPTEGGFVRKAVVYSTWEEYQQHVGVLKNNINAAVHEHDVVVEAGEKFRHIMEGTDVTFGEAIKRL
jgi:hypothetical protein